MKQILWIGCLENDIEFIEKAKKGATLASAQVSQKNVFDGIEDILELSFDSINGSVLPHYPVYRDRYVNEVKWSHQLNAQDISVGYLNYKYINKLTCKNSMLKAVDRWTESRYAGGALTVFVYSMRSAPMSAACKIKKIIPHAKIYLIVTDLPQFMDLGENVLKKMLKKIDWLTIKKMQLGFDGFVLYAKKMADFLNIPPERWVLMEGSCDTTELVKAKSAGKRQAIMYSGKLDKEYGLELLLNAFMQIQNENLELWLTGGGNAAAYIEECAKNDNRIKFFGFLPTRQDVLEMQSKATALINMRLPSEEASKYCFPSKLFEYMLAGVPVLSFRLEGIPAEYYEHLIVIEHETEECIVKTIETLLLQAKKDLQQRGSDAQAFVLENKTIKKQCQKILAFVNSRE